MRIEKTKLTDFLTATDVTEENSFKETYPGLFFGADTSVIETSTNTPNNFGLTQYIRLINRDNTHFHYLLYDENSQNGYQVQFDFLSSTSHLIKLNRVVAGTVTETLVEKEFIKTTIFAGDVFIPLKIYRAGSVIKIIFNHKIVYYNELVEPEGNKVKIVRETGSSDFYISDTIIYENQCIHGLFSVDGVLCDTGDVHLFYQEDGSLYEKTSTDNYGKYIILVETNPYEFNTFFMYGYDRNRRTTQPRGVCNIRLQS